MAPARSARAVLAWLLYGIATLCLLFSALLMWMALDPSHHQVERSTAIGMSLWITFFNVVPIGLGCAILAWLLRTRSPQDTPARKAMDRAAMDRLLGLRPQYRLAIAAGLVVAGIAWLAPLLGWIGRSSTPSPGQEFDADYVGALATQGLVILAPVVFAAATMALLARRVVRGAGTKG
jgi:hypothetical protein